MQQDTPFILTNDKGKCLSNGAFTALHKLMGVSGFTTHGFKSSFRDWAGNTTDYARDFAEEALGRIIGNKVGRAYRRGIAIEKRRLLMTEWGNYCTRGEGG